MNNLRILRAAKGLTVKDAAKNSNIAPSLWCRIETGKHSPNLKTLQKMAVGLQCEVEDLIKKTLTLQQEAI
jgi:transcriptional regulator with XRE-family HTH domain